MSWIEIFVIAISLSLDCFAVSISSGGTMRFFNFKNLVKMSFFFGFFQSIMPLIGYLAGFGAINYVEGFDHWIAFFLLVAIGIKMSYESYKIEEFNCSKNTACPFGIQTLIILSISTSIDALAVGFTFSLLKMSILIPVIIIGIVAFLVSMLGIIMGYKGKKIFGKKMEFIAGSILILIGFKVLISHLI
ncbi:MAG: manganese efflux pump MntP family protein [Elusimicrobiales bacterium]